MAWNQNNVSEWSDMSTHGLLFQWVNTENTTKAVGRVQDEHYHPLIKCYLFLSWYSWKKMAYLVLNNNHSFTHSLIIYYKSKHLSVTHLNVTFFCYKLLINYIKVVLISHCTLPWKGTGTHKYMLWYAVDYIDICKSNCPYNCNLVPSKLSMDLEFWVLHVMYFTLYQPASGKNRR